MSHKLKRLIIVCDSHKSYENIIWTKYRSWVEKHALRTPMMFTLEERSIAEEELEVARKTRADVFGGARLESAQIKEVQINW